MNERDRVLDAFRNCITEPKCKDCPWTECETIGHGTIEIPRDLALAVMRELVAQEPRVMTLDEALGGDERWVEYQNGGCGYADCYISYTAKGADIYRTMQHDFNVPLDTYGKTWRCWTSRPTDAQREAVKWE